MSDDARVALCPVTPELADGLCGFAELDAPGYEAVEERLVALGWRSPEDLDAQTYDTAPEIPDCDLVSPLGHFTYVDGGLIMPFAYKYWIGNELLEDDYWGALPGWSSQKGARRAEFDAHAEAAVQVLTERLGPALWDVRQPKCEARHVAWRVGPSILMIAQGLEPISYYQFHDAQIFICSATADHVQVPGGPPIRNLVTS